MGEDEKIKTLKIAKNCLKQMIEVKDKNSQQALMFQFCKQMERFAKLLSKEKIQPDHKMRLNVLARKFESLSKIWKARRRER
mgnify:CR=1 FL=1